MSDPVDQRKKRSLNMTDNGMPRDMYQTSVRSMPMSMQEPEEEYMSSEDDLDNEELYDQERAEMGGDEESGEEYEEEYMEPEYDEMDGEGHQQRAEVEQPRAQVEQPSPSRAQAQAPAEPPMRGQAEQLPPRAQAELPSQQRAQAEQLPPRSQAEYQPTARASRVPPHVNTAKSNGNRNRRIVLGLGSDGPKPAVMGPLYNSSSKAPPPQRTSKARNHPPPVVNGRAPHKTNSFPPAVASAQSQQVSIPPQIPASGHGFVTDRTDEFDHGTTPDEDIIFSGSFDIRFSATGQELANEPAMRRFTLTETDLRNIFRVSVKNPDKKLTDPGAYDEQRMDMSQVLINKWCIKGFTQNTSSILDVMADPERLKFLNTHYKSGMERHCMLTIGPKAKQSSLGEKAEVIIDNHHLINTKAFKTFGHTSVSRFAQDIEYPHGEQRLKIRQGSQLSKLIIDNQARLKEHFIKVDPIIESCPGGHLVNPDVVFEALLRYHVNVSPLMRGIVDAKKAFVFELLPGQESTWQEALSGSLANYASTPINVHLIVGVEYCFPESYYNRYKPPTATAPMVDVRQQFQQRLKDSFML